MSKLVRFICYSNDVAVCPDNCGNSSCMSDGQCCHESCLGGCTGPGNENCLVCRDVVFENMCVKHCPSQTYKVNQSRSCEAVWFGKFKEAWFQIWGLHSVEDLCCSFVCLLFEYPWFRDTCCLCICGEDQRMEALCISELIATCRIAYALSHPRRPSLKRFVWYLLVSEPTRASDVLCVCRN